MSTLVVIAVTVCTRVGVSTDTLYQNSLSDPLEIQDSHTDRPYWVSNFATLRGIGISLLLGVHRNTWNTTSIVVIYAYGKSVND